MQKKFYIFCLAVALITSIAFYAAFSWALPPSPPASAATIEPGLSAYYVVTKATSAPANATNLGGGSTGLVFCTVANSTCTFSVKAIGTDVQAYSAGLASIAGLTEVANGLIYTTADNTYAALASSANMISLLQSADYSAARTNLSLVPGTNVQAYDADLASLAGLTETAGDMIYYTASDTAAILDTGAAYSVMMINAGGTAPSWIAPTNNGIWGCNGSGVCAYYTAISIDDSAAQFYNAGTTSKKMKVDPSGMTANKTLTVKGSFDQSATIDLVNTALSADSKTITLGLACADDCTLTFPSATATLAPLQKGYLWIPAGTMIPDTCSGLLQYDTGTNIIDYLAFDYATEEFAEFSVVMPDDWDAGTVKVKFYWTAAATIAGTNGDDVLWDIKCGSTSDGVTADVTYGDAVEVTDEYATADETGPIVKISAASAALTVGGTPAVADLITCRVSRNSDAAGDEYDAGATSDLWLIGVKMEYGKNATAATAW